MDFSLSEAQQELRDLARKILDDRMTLAHLKARDHDEEWYDLDTWQELAKTNLLGVAIPEASGGLGLGFLDLCVVLQEIGRTVAPLPAVACLGAALPIARFGTDDQSASLSQVASGEIILTAALQEYGSPPEAPQTLAVRAGDGWRIDGTKTGVPAFNVADTILVSARVDDGAVAVFLVPADATGVFAQRQQTMNHEPQFELRLEGVELPGDALLGSVALGREILDWTLARVIVATCAVVSGVADRAMRITAQYACDRKQFDRAIGTFQAVGQRMADCFIDNQAIELTMLQAATHLDEGREVPAEVATAKYWAAEGGSRIGHAALHVHGGISIDIDYPIHRYFLWIKQHEFTLGAATPQLVRLGEILAAEPA